MRKDIVTEFKRNIISYLRKETDPMPTTDFYQYHGQNADSVIDELKNLGKLTHVQGNDDVL